MPRVRQSSSRLRRHGFACCTLIFAGTVAMQVGHFLFSPIAGVSPRKGPRSCHPAADARRAAMCAHPIVDPSARR
eukprot:12361456-Alexandrium_andersonii.AAC.1